jgi:predicted nucleotidyltransferase
LGREVDLLTEAALSPYLRESMLRDLRVIYEA